MVYKKVYYDEIWGVTSVGAELTSKWVEKMDKIRKKQGLVIDDKLFRGSAAESTKTYYKEVHGTLLATLMTICQTFMAQSASYYVGYKNKVDAGDGSDFGLRYTTIVYSEVDETGSVPQKIKKVKAQAQDVSDRALQVKREISDLVQLSSPKLDELINQLNKASKYATDTSKKVVAYENSRANDFYNIDQLINHARKIIEYQLGDNRTPVRTYVSGTISKATDFKDLYDNLESCGKIVEAFQNSKEYEEAMNLAFNRETMIEEEEKADREWVKWIAVGVAVVGSIVVIAVTAGGATPLVCAGVGAAVGLTTAATNSFTDNYIENGSLTEGMDWSDFGKECVIGAATGAVSGYIGATSTGSVIKQPIDAAISSVASTVVEEATGGLINIGWEVGEAFVSGKPGGEIMSVLEDTTGEMMKDIVVEGTTSFATGFVSGKFDVDSSKKGFFKKLGEETAENATKNFVHEGVEFVWDVGDAVLDPESSKNFTTILNEEFSEHSKKAVEGFVQGEIEAIAGGAFDKFSNHDGKTTKDRVMGVVDNVVADTFGTTAGAFAGGIAGQGIDIVFGNADSIDIAKVWDEKLDDGRVILTAAGNSAGKNVSDEVFKDEKFFNDLKKKDYDDDGTVDVVVFDKYMVLKEDYDAAREVAGKGAYKDKTVQDILGLPKNTAISEKKVKQETISINALQESDYKARKTTNVTKMDYKVDYDQVKQELFDKDLFNSNKAGEYTYTESEKGKTASGYLTLEKGERDTVAQRTVGGNDRKASDDGGHLIGTRFNGSGGTENLDAQNSNLNRSAYNKKEEEWVAAIDKGDKVYVHVETHKSEGSDRPTEYMGYAIIEHTDGTRDLDPFVFANKKNSQEKEWIVFEK